MSTIKVEKIQHPNSASVALTLDTSGYLALQAGSASTPAIQGPSDPNTGIFFPAADTIAFAEGGTEVLRIDSSGRVGIGTSSASYQLDVVGGSGLRVQRSTGTTIAYFENTGSVSPNIAFGGSTTTSTPYIGVTANDLFLGTNGSERIRISSGGNVGINTTSPETALHVYSGSGVTARFTKAANPSSIALGTDTAPTTLIEGLSSGGTVFYNMTGTWASPTYTERARIDSSGRLLVGFTSTSSSHLICTSGSGASNAANLAGFTIGNSNSEYPSAGCNIKFTSSTNSYQYNGSDYAAMIRYGQNSGRIETFTAPSGTAGNTISFTAGPYVANTGTSWTNSSDERLKTDLLPIEDAFTKVGTLRAVTGRYKTDENNKRRSFLIAQDVQAVLPEAVDSVDPNNLGLSYSDVIPLLVAALKESKERIEQLETEMAEVKAQLL